MRNIVWFFSLYRRNANVWKMDFCYLIILQASITIPHYALPRLIIKIFQINTSENCNYLHFCFTLTTFQIEDCMAHAIRHHLFYVWLYSRLCQEVSSMLFRTSTLKSSSAGSWFCHCHQSVALVSQQPNVKRKVSPSKHRPIFLWDKTPEY